MRVIGLIMVFAGCSAAGFVKSYEFINSQNELYAFIQLIRFIKREVALFLTRQQEIFERFENVILEKNGFLKTLREQDINDEKSPLYHTLILYEGKLKFNREAIETIMEFSESFGRLSREEQEEKCSLTLEILEEIYNKEKENNTSRIKLCRSVGSIIGAAMVLLFV